MKCDSPFPLVSIIIPTFNSGKSLELCLKSILNQSYKNIEIIIVDAFSKDNTKRIAKKFGAKLFFSASERSLARNFGAKKAKGKFVLFVDSDMELTPNVVAECVKLSYFNKFDAVIIPEKSVGESFIARCKKLEKTMHMREVYGEAPRFFKKKVFDDVGGYDKNLVIGEDFELTQRLRKHGFVIGKCKASIKHHEEDLTTKKLIAKLYYYGSTLPFYFKKEPILTLKTSSPAYFVRNLSFFKKQPLLFVGLLSLKLIEYAAYIAGFLTSFLSLRNLTGWMKP